MYNTSNNYTKLKSKSAINELSTPENIRECLRQSFAPSSSHEASTEKVFFFEAPNFWDGFKYSLFWLMVGISVTVFAFFKSMLLMPAAEIEADDLARITNSIIGNQGFLFSVMWFLLCFWATVAVSRYHFFGFKIVTNYRAAFVIPNGFYFFGAPTKSTYFGPTLKKLSSKGLLYEFHTSKSNRKYAEVKLYHLARVIHSNSRTYGSVRFYAPGDFLDFLNVENTSIIQDILVHVAGQYIEPETNSYEDAVEQTLKPSSRTKMHTKVIFCIYVIPIAATLFAGYLMYYIQILNSNACVSYSCFAVIFAVAMLSWANGLQQNNLLKAIDERRCLLTIYFSQTQQTPQGECELLV